MPVYYETEHLFNYNIKKSFGNQYYSVCKNMFLQIPIEESYLLILRILKKRMYLEKEEFVKIPYELKFLAYFMELTYDDYQKLRIFLECQYGGA